MKADVLCEEKKWAAEPSGMTSATTRGTEASRGATRASKPFMTIDYWERRWARRRKAVVGGVK